MSVRHPFAIGESRCGAARRGAPRCRLARDGNLDSDVAVWPPPLKPLTRRG
jgi:hypothetical protein